MHTAQPQFHTPHSHTLQRTTHSSHFALLLLTSIYYPSILHTIHLHSSHRTSLPLIHPPDIVYSHSVNLTPHYSHRTLPFLTSYTSNPHTAHHLLTPHNSIPHISYPTSHITHPTPHNSTFHIVNPTSYSAHFNSSHLPLFPPHKALPIFAHNPNTQLCELYTDTLHRIQYIIYITYYTTHRSPLIIHRTLHTAPRLQCLTIQYSDFVLQYRNKNLDSEIDFYN